MTPAEEDAPRIKTAAEYGCPERIWLQHDPLNTGEPFDESSETTWCQHRIEDTDAEYVRADLHDEAIRAAVEAERERREQLEAALRELVRLKAIKDRIDAGKETDYERADYGMNKPLAWDNARKLIGEA